MQQQLLSGMVSPAGFGETLTDLLTPRYWAFISAILKSGAQAPSNFRFGLQD